MDGTTDKHGRHENTNILVVIPNGRRPLGRVGVRWECGV
jgi:hypothetical protein